MMLCENCKENPASVHVEQISGGQKTELHLCQECSVGLHAPLFLDSLLKSLIFSASKLTEESNEKNVQCECGMKLSEFKKLGKLGCEQCYTTFKKELAQLLRNIQWSMNHTGKIPVKNAKGIIKKKEIKRLREELQQAIEEEEYETAAQLRDQIKDIERGEADEMV